MSHRDFSSLQIPSTLPVEDVGHLCGASFVSEQVYRVHLPQGLSGNLMRLKGGEFDGLLTTSVMGPRGIEGTAALEPVSIASIGPLITLRRLQVMSDSIRHLIADLNRLQKSIYDRIEAEVEGSITILADIASRIDEALLDDAYRTTLLTDLRRVKGQLGNSFELELKSFGKQVDRMCEGLRGPQFSNACILNIPYLGKSDSFMILNLISICELLEIMLQGSYSKGMMQASAKHLRFQRDKIISVAKRYYDGVVSHLEQGDDNNKSCERNWYWHEARDKEHIANLSNARKAFEALGQSPVVLDALLSGNSTKEELEELWLFVQEGRLEISSERPYSDSFTKSLTHGG